LPRAILTVIVVPRPGLLVAAKGELEGVRQQVEDDLLPHAQVDVDGFWEGRALDPQCHTGLLERRSELAGEVRRPDGAPA